MYGEDTLDTLVFPRLRLKSDVISSVVDGSIDNSFNIKESVNVPIYKVIDQIKIPEGFKSKYRDAQSEVAQSQSEFDEMKVQNEEWDSDDG